MGAGDTAGPDKRFDGRRIWATIVIDENLPRRQAPGLVSTPGRTRVLTGGLEAETGRQRPGAGRQKRSVCQTTGLRCYGQGFSPRLVVLQHQKCAQNTSNSGEVCMMVLICGARE